MKYQAIGKYVVLKEIKEEQATKSGIIIAQNKKFTDGDGNIRFGKGQIVSVGKNVLKEWDVLKKDEIVLYNRADAHKLEIDSDLYVVDCVAIQVKIQ